MVNEIERDIALIKKEIDNCYNMLDYAQDKEIIDSIVYQIKSLNLKYEYYIKLCKQNGYKAQRIDMIS